MNEVVPSSLYFEIFAFVVSLALCSLFSFLETSVTALRLFKLKEISSKTNRYSGLFQVLEQNPHRVLITILIAACLVNVTASALIADIMEVIFAQIHFSTSYIITFSPYGFDTFCCAKTLTTNGLGMLSRNVDNEQPS